jgi:hypothetical protein
MEQQKYQWIKIGNARPIELDITGMRNVNSFISILKTRFELETPEHLLVLKRAGQEIPADIEVTKLVSTFNEPLILVSPKRYVPLSTPPTPAAAINPGSRNPV